MGTAIIIVVLVIIVIFAVKSGIKHGKGEGCLLYTSDAADEL